MVDTIDFKPLYYADRLYLINPYGDVSITTLWSRPTQVIKWLTQQEIDLSPQTSRVAVVANLYGNGLPQMLRNLLFNPQINYILILGQNLSGSQEELNNFFELGLEETLFLGTPAYRIVGTTRIIDNLVKPADFKQTIKISNCGKLETSATPVQDFFNRLPAKQPCVIARNNVPLPKVDIRRFPSEPRNHNILQKTPLLAWQELIFHLVRFGHRNQLKKGERLELQNVKVIIEEPIEESAELLNQYGFSLAHFKQYQENILSSNLLGQPYSYGNRLRSHFQIDTLETVINVLSQDINSRHAYIALWDTHCDLERESSVPCLVSLFFRYFDTKLTLTATFRTHNALSAWLENVYGLMAIQNYVIGKVNKINKNPMDIERGAITVFSHSISVDVNMLSQSKFVVKNFKKTFSVDPNGEFAVTVDKEQQEIVVQHTYQGAVIAEYRGKTSEAVERQLAKDCALSDIGHALYLGREMAKKAMLLKN
jgi:thymidylate synthase